MNLDKAAAALKTSLAVAGSVLPIVSIVRTGSHSWPPGRLVTAEPMQIETSPRTWEKSGLTITALAQYRIDALVISTERYWFDSGAALAPVDFAVGWGPMSDRAVLDKLSFSQGSRWYRYQSRGAWPIPQDEINLHSANMHMIPANREIEGRLKAVRASDIVTLRGYLVEAHGPNRSKWRSSLSRTDVGAGACELMWVEEVSKRE